MKRSWGVATTYDRDFGPPFGPTKSWTEKDNPPNGPESLHPVALVTHWHQGSWVRGDVGTESVTAGRDIVYGFISHLGLRLQNPLRTEGNLV